MLLGSSTLEIAIGLAFIYVLLALICSTLNEWIAGILGLRSKTLRKGIANLLEDPDAKGLARKFFEHPLVKGLARKGKNDFPSYIPARTFTLALIDIVLPAEGGAGSQSLLEVYEKIRVKLAEFSNSNSDLAKALLILLNQAGVDPKKIDDAAFAVQQLEQVRTELLEFVGQLDPSEVGTLSPLAESLDRFQQLEVALRQAEVDARSALFQAQQNVERYYDDAMDRVSGWYKRRAQVIIVILAVMLTGILNADSLAIANRFVADPVLRSKVADAATLYLQEHTGEAAGAAPSVVVVAPSAGETRPAGSTTVSVTLGSAVTSTTPVTTTTTTAVPVRPSTEISETLNALTSLDLPLGWAEIPQDTESWLIKITGLLVTVVAVSLGAPFWFGLLNKLVNLRMAGAKPEPTPAPAVSGNSSVLETRLVPDSATRVTPSAALRGRSPDMTDLAARALQYVEQVKGTRTLTVPERDLAVGWMMMETAGQQLPVTPAAPRAQPDELARLAARALEYVAQVKGTRPLTVPERDVAEAWMVMEAASQRLPVTREEIVYAMDQALKNQA